MERSTLNILLLPLVALLALYFPITASLRSPAPNPVGAATKSASTPTPAAEATPDPLSEENATVRLLAEFLGLSDDPAPGKPTPRRKDWLGKIQDALGRITQNGTQVEYLILTAPDPVDSRLDYFFDRDLEGVQRAIEQTGYSLDRYWLPWPLRGKEASSRKRANHAVEPGVLLFRRFSNLGPDEPAKLLLVLVVGETPTTGIHRGALQNALEQITLFSGMRPSFDGFPPRLGARNQLEVRILGPTFSGSALSLGLTVKTWLGSFVSQAPPRVRVTSGTATSIDSKIFLESLIDHPDQVTFHTTTVPDETTIRQSIRYLSKRFAQSAPPPLPGIAPAEMKIAILAESNTDYGRAISDLLTSETASVRILSLPFPLHISQLRGTALKLKPLQNSASPESTPSPGANLPLPIGDEAATVTKDAIPLLTPLQLASTELVMSNILSTINREGIRYIGLFATDVRDQLYLVRELRAYCPNTMIFTSDADLLSTRPEVNRDFLGVLVFSPYPLFNLNQRFSSPFEGDRYRLQFESSFTQGVYNAAMELFGQPERMLEYGFPLVDMPSFSAGNLPPPPLWVSIVGNNGVWPIHPLVESERNARTARMPSPSGAGTAPRLSVRPAASDVWRLGTLTLPLVLLLIAASSFLPLLVLLPHLILQWRRTRIRKARDQGRDKPPKWMSRLDALGLERIHRLRVSQYFEIEDDYKYGFDCRVYLFTGSVPLLIISILISGLYLSLGRTDFFPVPLWLRVSCGLILGISIATILWLLGSLLQWMFSRGGAPWKSGAWAAAYLLAELALAGLAGGGVFSLFRKATQSPGAAAEVLFFYLRTRDLSNGVSLLLPWMFLNLAAVGFAICNLRRLHLAERMNPLAKDARLSSSFLNLRTPSFEGVSQLEARLNRLLLLRAYQLPGSWLLSPAFVLIFAYVLLFQPIQFVDERGFDLFLKGMFLFTPLLLLWSVLRFLAIWRAMKSLLRRLSWHPMFRAPTEEEEKQMKGLPRLTLTSPAPTYTSLTYSVHQAERHLNLLSPAGPGVPARRRRRAIEAAATQLRRALSLEAQGAWGPALPYRLRAQRAVSALARQIARDLEPLWDRPPEQEAFKQGKLFLIAHVGAYLQHIFAHLQNLLSFVTVCLLLLLLAVGSYPFQFRETLLLASWIAILTTVALTFWMFLDASRDRVLSLLAGTTPGKVNVTRDLVSRILVHVVLPLVALLGAQFPDTLRQLLSWFGGSQSGS